MRFLLLGFVEPSFVWSGLMTRPNPNNVALFLMGDFWGLVHGVEAWGKKNLARFVAHGESCAQDVENAILWLGFVSLRDQKQYSHT